jgi:hypothetical protein
MDAQVVDFLCPNPVWQSQLTHALPSSETVVIFATGNFVERIVESLKRFYAIISVYFCRIAGSRSFIPLHASFAIEVFLNYAQTWFKIMSNTVLLV